VEPEGDISIKGIPAGLYAVTRCEGLQNIGEVWNQLATWREGSKYRYGSHQWLEQLLSPADVPFEAYIFDLYLPIAE
jgi:DNA gyrase inhibitor GyrI